MEIKPIYYQDELKSSDFISLLAGIKEGRGIVVTDTNAKAMLDEMLDSQPTYVCVSKVLFGLSDVFMHHVNDALEDEQMPVSFVCGNVMKTKGFVTRYTVSAFIDRHGFLQVKRFIPTRYSISLSKRKNYGRITAGTTWFRKTIKELVQMIEPATVTHRRNIGDINYLTVPSRILGHQREVKLLGGKGIVLHILMEEEYDHKLTPIKQSVLGRFVSQTQSYEYEEGNIRYE